MKSTSILLAIFFHCCFVLKAGAQKKPPNATSLKVISYNIHHSSPPELKNKIDIEAIIDVLRPFKADLIALQEVDVDTKRSGKGNQAQKIAKALGMYYAFSKAFDYEGGAYGVAILSRFPLTAPQTLRLPNAPEEQTEQRIMAYSKIKVPGYGDLWFGSTHLDYKSESRSRELQAKKIIDFYAEQSLPFILAGDFNAFEGSSTIQELDKHFSRSCYDCPFTIPVKNPKRTIDYIFYSKNAGFKATAHQVIKETYASDHRPVFTELKMDK